MLDPLLRKTLSDLRGQTLGWGIGIGLLLMLTVLLYPSVGTAYVDVIDQLLDAGGVSVYVVALADESFNAVAHDRAAVGRRDHG